MDGDDYEPFSKASLFEPTRTSQDGELMYLVNGCFKHAHIPDGEVNAFGKRLLQTCAFYGLEILNGVCPGGETGNFTFLSEHGHSVVDYFLMSSGILY